MRLSRFFLNESPGAPDWERAALSMNLANVDAQVLNVQETADFAEVAVKFRVPREYAENIETYLAPSTTRRGGGKRR